ncbi:hypothetical protein ACVRXQ_05085 [Streptococcus panodentis]|nr:hypothetical protein [Streptococcus panodentis]
MKKIKIASLLVWLLLIVILFPLNPYLSAFLAVASLGIAFLMGRK